MVALSTCLDTYVIFGFLLASASPYHLSNVTLWTQVARFRNSYLPKSHLISSWSKNLHNESESGFISLILMGPRSSGQVSLIASHCIIQLLQNVCWHFTDCSGLSSTIVQITHMNLSSIVPINRCTSCPISMQLSEH